MRLERLGAYRRAIVSIAIVVAVAIPAAGYILSQERLQAPWASQYMVSAAFDNATAVEPGLGEPVDVAGVHVGQIAGVELHDGHAVLRMQIDPGKLPRVYANARATLIPNTPLKDMQVDLVPGGPPAKPLSSHEVIPLARTSTPIDADQFLHALDADTRDWLTTLISNLDYGTRGRGPDMRALLRTMGPTAEQAREIASLLVHRRGELRRLTHNLATLTHAAAAKDREIAQVVDAGNATLGALAGQDAALQRSIAELPGTLRDARGTLHHVTGLARSLRPALESLMPTARRVQSNLRDSDAFFQGNAVLPIRSLPPFTNAVLPLASQLGPVTRDLTASTPPLVEAFGVLREITNEMAYNPGGSNQGYLYWLAWFAHNVDSVVSTEDANGAVGRGLGLISCSTATQPGLGTVLSLLLGTSPASGGCPAP